MNQYLHSYLVKADDFRKLYGSKNAAALKKLTGMLTDDLDDIDDEFSDDTDETCNSAAVLADIMNANIRFPEVPQLYALVYEKLCARFGKQFFPPNDEYSVAYWNSVHKDEDKPFMPLPRATEFPQMYSISVADLEKEKENFLSAPALSEHASADEEQADFSALFEKAIAENKDIQFFLY